MNGIVKKALILRHAQENSRDQVSAWLQKNRVDTHTVIPAFGDTLPDDASIYDALIVYGGVQSANDGPEKTYIEEEIALIGDWATSDRPVLGICLGAQMLSKALGGDVQRRPDKRFEIGFTRIGPTRESDGFLKQPRYFYQWHGEGFTIPAGGVCLARGDVFPNQAFRYGVRAYGLQFHPEVTAQIMQEWIGSAEGKLDSMPGAHNPAKQIQDESLYGADMHEWLFDFLSEWKKIW